MVFINEEVEEKLFLASFLEWEDPSYENEEDYSGGK